MFDFLFDIILILLVIAYIIKEIILGDDSE